MSRGEHVDESLPTNQPLPPDVSSSYFDAHHRLEGEQLQELIDNADMLATYGPEFPAVIDRIKSSEAEHAADYAMVFSRLMGQVERIRWMFPPEEADMGVQVSKELVAHAAFAVDHHLSHGNRTEGEISLRNGRTLPVEFDGPEPLYMLHALSQAYWVAGEVMQRDTVGTVHSVKGHGFNIYRFIDTTGELPPCASISIRPEGDIPYDPRYEYGKRGYGVEASVSLNVDLDMLNKSQDGNDIRLMDLRKAGRQHGQTVSLRLDREGVAPDDRSRVDAVRDARKQEGTLSHDVDSVFGRIGLFLAWGDHLHKQAVGGKSELNHLPRFSDELGTTNGFARVAHGIEQQVRRKLLDKKKLATLTVAPKSKTQSNTFPTFELGQDPFDIGNGAVRELAEKSGIELPNHADDEVIQMLFKAWGKDFRYSYNMQRFSDTIGDTSATELICIIKRTGITQPMPLRNIYGPVTAKDIDHVMLLEGTAGWINKRAALVERLGQRHHIGAVVLGTTTRVMDAPTELVNPSVNKLSAQLGRLPNATEYMHHVTKPQLEASGLHVKDIVSVPLEYEEGGITKRSTAEDTTRAIVQQYPEVLGGLILKAETAPAGGMFVGPLMALHEQAPGFDLEQFLIASGGVPLARTRSQLENPVMYQNPYLAPSSLVRWISGVHKLNQTFAD